MNFVKRVFRKVIVGQLFRKYVLQDLSIEADILQTLETRGSKAIEKPKLKQFEHLMLYYPEFAFIFFWRIRKQPYYYSWFTKDFHCKIFQSTKIAGGLMCYHPFATVINAKSIGRNFQFRNGLTVGNKNNDNTQLPTIGDNVVVGANVVIIGAITIGDNVIIGAGSVVVKDVPSNVVVAGNPAQIIRSISNE